jgi:hypothetical protein
MIDPLSGIDARTWVQWRVSCLSANMNGAPLPPWPRPRPTYDAQRPHVEERPSEAAELVARMAEAALARRRVIAAVGKAGSHG